MNIQYVGNSRMIGVNRVIAEFNTYMSDIHMNCDDVNIYVVDEEHAKEYFDRFIGNKDGIEFPGLKGHRGFCSYAYWKGEPCNIVVYATRYECAESIKWILFHEIFHYAVRKVPILGQHYIYTDEPLAAEFGMDVATFINDFALQTRDDVHDRIAEEIEANKLANNFIGKCYDRKWWREQIKLIDLLSSEDGNDEEQSYNLAGCQRIW